MCCLQAKPYKYRCSSCQAAVTSELAHRLFHVRRNFRMKLFSKITSHLISKYFGAMFQNGNVEVPQAKIFVNIFEIFSLPYFRKFNHLKIFTYTVFHVTQNIIWLHNSAWPL